LKIPKNKSQISIQRCFYAYISWNFPESYRDWNLKFTQASLSQDTKEQNCVLNSPDSPCDCWAFFIYICGKRSMAITLSIILFSIFIILAIIHFNWVIGGKWGYDKSLPTDEKGKRILNPRRIDSAIVGFGLLGFGLFYLLKSGVINFGLPGWIYTWAGWIIPVIFILRAIGEFKYVGFFKKIKTTDFGKMDTQLYSPLCLMIGVFGVLVALYS